MNRYDVVYYATKEDVIAHKYRIVISNLPEEQARRLSLGMGTGYGFEPTL